MSQNILSVTTREGKGRGHSRRLRAQGQIPAVIYGKSGSFSLAVDAADFHMLLRKIAGATAIITLQDQNKKKYDALIHQWQRNPMTDRFEHIDFLEVVAGQKVNAHLAVHTHGESIGVKNSGGVLEVVAYEIEISALPNKLPEQLQLDVSDLDVGQFIHVKDLPQFDGVEYLADPEAVVVACFAGRTAASESADEGAEAAADAGEAAAEADKE